MLARLRLWAAWLLIVAAQTAPGHTVYGRLTLSQMVTGADTIVIARIVDPEAELAVGEDQRRPVISAEILDVLKGDASRGPVLVARHGHGHTDYKNEDRALLFLTRIERHRELHALVATGKIDYVTLQETSANFRLAGGDQQTLVAAVRDYVALEQIEEPDERLRALKHLTLGLLSSPDDQVAVSAARDLAATADARLIDEELVPDLLTIVHEQDVLIGVRVTVLAMLEQQGLTDTASHWARLVSESEGADVKPAIRAAGAHPSEPVAKSLIEIVLEGPSPDAAEAAIALGWPGNDSAVPPLTGALDSGDSRLGLAAIRGLYRISTSDARKALDEAAKSHPDPAIRRRASAALRQ